MHLRHVRCRLFVFFHDCLVDDLMFLHQPVMLAEIFDIFEPVTIHLLGQVVHQLDQSLIPGGFHDNIM